MSAFNSPEGVKSTEFEVADNNLLTDEAFRDARGVVSVLQNNGANSAVNNGNVVSAVIADGTIEAELIQSLISTPTQYSAPEALDRAGAQRRHIALSTKKTGRNLGGCYPPSPPAYGVFISRSLSD